LRDGSRQAAAQGRFAIYFAPAAGSLLAKAGARWLGRDALARTLLPQPNVEGLSADRLAAITAAPRQYGFHATLKAPFSLVEGKAAPELFEITADLAAKRRPFSLSLSVGEISGFLALMPARTPEALVELEAACVQELDRFRASASQAEMEKRRSAGLSARQEALLEVWGYPYVLDEFRFHMTLTDRLHQPERGKVKASLQEILGPVLEGPVRIDSISVFEQPDRRTPFVEIARYPLSGGRRPTAPSRAAAPGCHCRT
jgi:putative phosphonate metabolism protein